MHYHWLILVVSFTFVSGEHLYDVDQKIVAAAAAFQEMVCKGLGNDCKVDGSSRSSESVFISDSNSRTVTGHKSLKKDESINVYCPGKGNFIAQSPSGKYAEGACMCGDIFAFPYLKDIMAVNSLTCAKPPSADVSVVGSGAFVADHSTSNYNRHLLQYATDGALRSNPRSFNFVYSKTYCAAVQTRIDWAGKDLEADVYDFHMPEYDPTTCCSDLTKYPDLFDQKSQSDSFNIQLGGIQTYITPDGRDYLVPAPLIPPYFIGPDAVAKVAAGSCHNMVPQFESIRKGNWLATHYQMRFYLRDWKNWEHEIYFIRGGSLTVPNLSGSALSVHATKDKDGIIQTELPIPEYTAMVLVYRDRKQGYVLITFNNPYIGIEQAKKRSHELCSYDAYTSGKYIGYIRSWNNDDPRLGYSFYCYVYDFFATSKLPYNSDLRFQDITHGLW